VAFARWDPIRDLLAIQQRLDRFAPGHAGWKPPVDLFETPSEYIVTAELPGVARTDIDIHFHDGRLTLSGVRHGHASSGEQFHRVERAHGSFSRTFQLPVPVDGDAIRADLRNGVLTVTCPKNPDAAARRIHIT
jgi:HSP20 family protein